MNRAVFYVSGLLLVLCLTAVTVHAQDEKEELTLRDIVKALKTEGKDSVKSERWRRTQSDYAKQVKVKFELPEIMTALSRKQDRDPSVDAYIKWQLLSFINAAGFKDQNSSKIMRLVKSAPMYVAPPPQTRLPRSMIAAWVAVDGKQSPDPEALKRANEAWNEYQQVIGKKLEFQNVPILEYRSALVRAIPRSTVLRPLFHMMDLEARAKSGLDVTREYGVKDKKGRTKKFNAAQIFTGVTRAEDYNPQTLQRLKVQATNLGGASGLTYVKPRNRGKDKGYEAGPKFSEPDSKLSGLYDQLMIIVAEQAMK